MWLLDRSGILRQEQAYTLACIPLLACATLFPTPTIPTGNYPEPGQIGGLSLIVHRIQRELSRAPRTRLRARASCVFLITRQRIILYGRGGRLPLDRVRFLAQKSSKSRFFEQNLCFQ